mgnify:CR=1 FL=1
MRIELVNTGNELMLGRVLNTHQQWLCRQLADRGWVVQRQTAVPDTGPAIREAAREALSRAEVVITTGGLGPTSDDLTRDLIAQLLGRPLREDAETLAAIARYFARRNRAQPPSTRVQAQVPEGATVLRNRFGTAPGLVLETAPGQFGPGGALLIMLPGPPRELRPMFLDQVLPLLRQRCTAGAAFSCRTLRTTGLGESRVEEIIAPPLAPLVREGLELGYCARPGEVDLRFAARGANAAELTEQAAQIARRLIPYHIYGAEDETLEQVVVQLLTKRGEKLSLAESCTGGLIAHRLTNVPGASAVFWGGWMTYANEAKMSQVGVNPATLAAHGAVSEAVACEMAMGARARGGTDWGLAVTGIAGPAGGSPEKPVGTVFIALAGPAGVRHCHFLNAFDRETFKNVTSQQALDLVRRGLLGFVDAGEP